MIVVLTATVTAIVITVPVITKALIMVVLTAIVTVIIITVPVITKALIMVVMVIIIAAAITIVLITISRITIAPGILTRKKTRQLQCSGFGVVPQTHVLRKNQLRKRKQQNNWREKEKKKLDFRLRSRRCAS